MLQNFGERRAPEKVALPSRRHTSYLEGTSPRVVLVIFLKPSGFSANIEMTHITYRTVRPDISGYLYFSRVFVFIRCARTSLTQIIVSARLSLAARARPGQPGAPCVAGIALLSNCVVRYRLTAFGASERKLLPTLPRASLVNPRSRRARRRRNCVSPRRANIGLFFSRTRY